MNNVVEVPTRDVRASDWIILSVLLGAATMLLRSVANSFARALQRARSNEQMLTQRNRELTTLCEGAAAISSNLSLNAVLQTVAEQITQAVKSSGCALSGRCD